VQAVAKALLSWRSDIVWADLPAEARDEWVAQALWALLAADHADEEEGVLRVFREKGDET
jgi:hypothetical protein